jgi:type I restriction enzyme S subunit
MNTILLSNLDNIIDAPNGIQELRSLILKLAIQGRLTPQSTSDIPVTNLISQIEKFKGEKIRNIEKHSDHLPDGWVEMFLSDFVHLEMGQSPDSNSYNKIGKGLPFYQGKSDYGKFTPTPSQWCTEPRKIGEVGDVLLSVRAPVGPTNFLVEKSCIGRGLAALRPLAGVETLFLLWWIRSFEQAIASLGTGTTSQYLRGDLSWATPPNTTYSEIWRIITSERI